MLVCQLPRKSSGRSFAEIHKIIKNYPAEKKIYIDCSAIRFMDSESVSCMVDMIRQMKSEGRSLYFYKPGERFITYIELANIRKMVSLITSGNELLDRYIKQKQSGSNSHCQNRYIITDNINNYVIKPEMIISVGRLDNTCDIILQDEQVSRIHALLLNTGNALYAVDCGSTNLTYINGWKSEPYCLNSLKVNDSIVFGNKSYFRIRQI
ncbi:MAG: FHA domain-containing protein [Desulfococcaceae bacterium]|nr:FHA domain-containing protein [Desulfococcaceae bacterium]